MVKPERVIIRNWINLFLSFKIDTFLPYNSIISLVFRGGRNNKNDWYYLQPFDNQQPGFVEISTKPAVKTLPLQITGKDMVTKFLICEKEGIRKGSTIEFNIKNTLVQSLVENNKRFDILIQKPDDVLLVANNPPSIDVINGVFDHVTIICPSIVIENEVFKVLVRIEDISYNLVEDFSDNIKLTLSEDSDSTNLFKTMRFSKNDKGLKFESEFYVPKPGIYHVEALHKDNHYNSNPIWCVPANFKNKLFWGYIHGHTNKSDGVRDPKTYFTNLVNAGLNFGTSTEHDHLWETSDEDFEEVKQIVEGFNSTDFVTIFGYEWGYWYTGGYGDICIYFSDITLPILRSDINKYNSTEKLIKQFKSRIGKVLFIAHHTALRPGFRNWDYFDNDLERLVEIYSTWGNQEYSSDQNNPLPPRYKFFANGKFAPKLGPIIEKKGSFVDDALIRGYKLGFTAGGDDHFGLYPSGMFNPQNGIYPSGIMAVWAPNLSRESLWNALFNRKCYGTTGPRIIIEFNVEQFSMGDVIDGDINPELLNTRSISINVISPITIEKLELVRNNKVFKTHLINNAIFKANYIDSESFQDISNTHQDKSERFLYYYPRIFLSKNNMAWASPIWIIQKMKF